MNLGRTVFSQLIAFLPDREFRRCVARYGGDRRLRSFSCWDQFLCMAFAQFTYRESLRDIEACLLSSPDKLYHMGIRGRVSRSTLADANETHDWRICADFAQRLIAIARPLYVRCRSPKLRKTLNPVFVTMLQAAPEAIHFKRILNFGEGQPFYKSALLRLTSGLPTTPKKS